MKWLAQLGKMSAPKRPGQIILLSGTSSSGKSTIAKLLQRSLYDHKASLYLHWSLDNFVEQAPPVLISQEIIIQEAPRLVYAFQAAIPVIANGGLDLIVDHVFTTKEWLDDFLQKTKRLDVIFVKVQCSLERTLQRERVRGDRLPGLAEYQFNRVHWDIKYDLTLDTTETEPKANAKLVFDYVMGVHS